MVQVWLEVVHQCGWGLFLMVDLTCYQIADCVSHSYFFPFLFLFKLCMNYFGNRLHHSHISEYAITQSVGDCNRNFVHKWNHIPKSDKYKMREKLFNHFGVIGKRTSLDHRIQIQFLRDYFSLYSRQLYSISFRSNRA